MIFILYYVDMNALRANVYEMQVIYCHMYTID